MFDFDNVGFSRTVEDGVKYLVCADCEMGPIGYHNTKALTANNFEFGTTILIMGCF